MNRILRLFVLTLVLLALVPAAAQDGTFGLSAEDFGQFQQANAQSFAKSQFSFSYDVALTIDGAPLPIDVALSGNGVLDSNGEMFSITINGNAAGTAIDGELRIVGDLLYGRVTDPTSGQDSGWFSVSLSDLQSAEINTDALGASLGQAFVAGAAEGAGVSQSEMDREALARAGFAAMTINPQDFIFISRSENTFSTEVSLAALFQSPAMATVSRELLAASAIAPTATDLEISQFNELLVQAFTDTTITLDQTVDPATNLVNQAALLIFSTVDPANFDAQGAPISTVFTLTVDVSGYDQPGNVTAPEGATQIPASLIADALAEVAPPPPPAGATNFGTGATAAGNTLSVGGSTVVSIPAGGTLEFPLNTTDTVTITARSLTGGLDPRVTVVDGAGLELGYNDDHTTGNADLGFLDAVVENVAIPGSATVRLEDGSAIGGEIEISVVSVAAGGAAAPAMPQTTAPVTAAGDAVPVELTCFSAAQEFIGDPGAAFIGSCPASCDLFSVWGTDLYTDDSNICTAAIHAGVVGKNGGTVTFIIQDGMDSYSGSERNGITTADWGSWGRSFTFNGVATGSAPAPAGAGAAIAVNLPNSYTFPNGMTFGYPDSYTINSESDVVTVLATSDMRN